MIRYRWPLLVTALIAVPARPATAQEGYSTEQADRGEAVFRRVCSACHSTVQFSSPGFRDGWNGRVVFELFEQIRTTMPQDNPGRLRREQYADVVAYLMRLNGQVAAGTGLGTDSSSLANIPIRFATRNP